jgi:hypothetical protein
MKLAHGLPRRGTAQSHPGPRKKTLSQKNEIKFRKKKKQLSDSTLSFEAVFFILIVNSDQPRIFAF